MSSYIARNFLGIPHQALEGAPTVGEAGEDFVAREKLQTALQNRGQSTKSIDYQVAPIEGSDEKLISGICNGDKEALGSLFCHYAPVVRSIAYKVLRDAFEADDLVQEIFLLIRRKCADFDRSKGSVRFWILQMAYHRAISRRRYLSCRHFYTRVELDDAQQKVSNPQIEIRQFEESIDASLGRSAVEKMFESLSENQRITLKRHFFDGYTLDEVAAELGQSRDNVRHHYFRGLDKLRKQLFAQKPGR